MRRLREERDSVPEQDEENTDMIRRIGGDPVLAQVGDGVKGGKAKAESTTAQPDGGSKGGGLSPEATERPGAVDAPCASPKEEAPPSSEDNGFFGDLFTTVVQEEVTPIESLTASLSDVSAEELLSETKQVKAMLRRKSRGGT